MTTWREEYQRIHLTCLERDIDWLTSKAQSVVKYSRSLSIPPIIENADKQLRTAEMVLADALADVREAQVALTPQKHLKAAAE